MPIPSSHFTMVGFPLDLASSESLSRTAAVYASACRPEDLSPAALACTIKDASGAELWFGLRRRPDGKTEIATVNPAFAGEGTAALDIDADVSDPDWTPFEIALSAHFDGDKAPIVVSLADPSDAARLKPGTKAMLDISAFGFAPSIYADDKAYFAAQKANGEKYVFAADFFIPTGMFSEKDGGVMTDADKRPQPYADFAGRVLKAELRTNKSGPGTFWAIEVQTYKSAIFDVVLDPTQVTAPPAPGNIVAGRFWLTAHLRTP